jgi:hypothetical protein
MVNQALRHLDHPPPLITGDEIAARAQTVGNRIRLRWAAGFLLAAAIAGTAVATPGSPLRGWLSTLAERFRAEAPANEDAALLPPAPMAGVALIPGPALVIEFTDLQQVGQARVTMTDDNQVEVRAPSGAATFSSDAERLVIENRGATADFEIVLPRGASRIEIRLAGARVLIKERERVTLTRGTAESAGWAVPLTAPR